MARFLAAYVAMRFAREFSSPDALKKYLHDHPDADRSLHHVEKHEPKKHHEDDHGDNHDKKPKSWKERLKTLSSKAQEFIKSAPKEVSRFLNDEQHRKAVATKASEALANLPEASVKRVIDTVKHEVHEFKEASEGIRAVLGGKKMNDHQKKALKTVAFHVGLTLAATTLTVSGGPLVGMAAFGKSMVRHVAMKAASNSLGHLHILDELGHVGHGIQHILHHTASEKQDPDEVLVTYVSRLMADAIKDMKDDDLPDLLEGSVKESEKTAARVAKEFSSPEALQEYLQKHPKADKKRHKVVDLGEAKPQEELTGDAPAEKVEKTPKKKKPKKDELATPKASSHANFAALKVTPEEVEALVKKHAKTFDAITKDGKERLASYKEINRTPPGSPHIWSLEEPEQVYLVSGHLAGKEFLKSLTPEETKLHDRLHENWIISSQSDTSQELHGFLADIGINGSMSPDELGDNNGKVNQLRARGAQDTELATYVKKAFAFQQAFYQHIGLKEMTLFRGVRDSVTDSAETGSPTQIQTREAASFSTSPEVASAFGRVIEYKVPVANMLFSGAAAPRYQGERETIVMGGTDLIGHVQEKSVPKENDDE